jgi:hypothetical protein
MCISHIALNENSYTIKWKGEGGQTTAFGLGAADASTTEFRMKSALFFQEVGDDLLLVAIDPAGEHGDKNLQNHGDSWGCKR